MDNTGEHSEGGSSTGGSSSFQGTPIRDEKTSGFSVRVSEIAESISKEKLQEIFEKHGKVLDVTMSTCSDKPRFGYVFFEDKDDAANAIQSVCGLMLGGRALLVKWGDESDAEPDPWYLIFTIRSVKYGPVGFEKLRKLFAEIRYANPPRELELLCRTKIRFEFGTRPKKSQLLRKS
ncbi:uncharacterized protein LOC129585387 isoform X2 [Paramacrobiotus metropolitanus]|uniref:uncharacterized protein LOC129585387 isoform X2 n=1 Tax=Paramacrobiotus metropolitanus TaxID=2943436 RepID=UPI00244596D4|nr:uncharacterized protein LOC129585387 isoform X2 [Paramacrobiotus metropolitanus]